MDDVIHDVCAKLIHRHPHIFGDVQADTSEAVLNNWEAIKTEEKHRIGLSGTLQSVPPALPALMRAQKMVKKSIKAGITPVTEDVLSGACGDLESLRGAAASGNTEQMERDMSRLLWHLSALAQMHGLDAEKLLSDQCVSYISRVDEAEKRTKNSAVLDENGKKALLDENFS